MLWTWPPLASTAVFRSRTVIGLTLLAALVRFATLDAQSFWYDEMLTHQLANDSFTGMLHGVFDHEAQPPPYFILVWLTDKLVGSGEVGLRFLSALCGTLTIPVAYEAARMVAGRRAAIATALLATFSPALVWYSQEARAYALVTFLGAVALLCFLRALDTWERRDLTIWVAASLLAVASHYFALFLVLPMGAYLLLRSPDRRRLLPWIAAFGAGLVAIMPMLLYQREHTGVDWIGEIPLWPRVRDVVFFFAAGPNGAGSLRHHRDEVFGTGVAFAVLTVGAALVLSAPRVRRRVLLVLGIAVSVLLVPYLASLVGSDYILERNFLPAWVPLTIVMATGLTAVQLRWAGPAVVGLVCVAFAGISVVGVPRNPLRQRDDWRAVAERIGPPVEDRVVVQSPSWHGRTLTIYQPGMDFMKRAHPVRKLYTVELETFVPHGDPVTTIAPGPPFHETLYARIQNLTLREYTAPQPVMIDPNRFRGVGSNRGEAFYQPAEP
jgi:4-amino-4-deoxy-L-arabinose transferase-like glycosyltransferase